MSVPKRLLRFFVACRLRLRISMLEREAAYHAVNKAFHAERETACLVAMVDARREVLRPHRPSIHLLNGSQR